MGTEYLGCVHCKPHGSEHFRHVAVINFRKNCDPYNDNYGAKIPDLTAEQISRAYSFDILERCFDAAFHDGLQTLIAVPYTTLCRTPTCMEYMMLLAVADMAATQGETVVCIWAE